MAGWNFFLDGIQVEEPIGWDAVEFTAIRMESHGIDQPFSTELKFYNQGAKYIKSQYDQYFINAQIAIQITSDVLYNGQPWQFDGFLNLMIYEEKNVCDTDSWEITVGILDDNFREEFKSRQEVEVALETTTDLNGNAINSLTYKSVRLHKQDLYLVASGRNFADQYSFLKYVPINSPPYDWQYPDYINVVPVFWGNTDFKQFLGSTMDTQGSSFTNTNVIFVNNMSITRNLTFNIQIDGEFTWYPFTQGFNPGDTADIDFYIRVFDNAALNDTFYLVGTTGINTASNPGTVTQFNISNTISNVVVPPDYRVLLLMYWGTGGTIKREVSNGSQYEKWLYPNIENVCVKLSEINPGEYASFCNGLTIEQYLKGLIYIMTGSNNKLLSDAFSETGNGCYWNNLLTNGLKIRNAQTIDQIQNGCTDEEDQTIIKTSWKKTFEELDKIFCLGWAFEWDGTEWKIRVEPREYFYQNSISQVFNHVGEVIQMAKVDKMVNNIVLGYSDKWKNISVSGAWAIHTDRNYFVGNRAISEGSSSTLDIRSDIIAEGYAIEFSRRMSFVEFDSGSSDRPNDYETFIIWLNRAEVFLEDIEGTCFAIPDETGNVTFAPGTISTPSSFLTFSSSPLENIYNISHTPARVAFRHWKILGMHTYGLTNPRLRFQVGEYQTNYSSEIQDLYDSCQVYLEDTVLNENTDIYPDVIRDGQKEYLFRPIAIEFSYPQSLCDFLTLSQDEQYRKIRLTSGSLDLQGFIQEATNQPEDSSGGTTKFTLLMSNQVTPEAGEFNEDFNSDYNNG